MRETPHEKVEIEMNTTALFIALLLPAVLFFPDAAAQEDAWLDLQNRSISHYQSKDHRGAVDTQRRALDVAEKTFGPEDLKVAESLDNLAIYSEAAGDRVGAEAALRRALAIMERSLSPDDPYLGIFVDYVGSFLIRIRKEEEGMTLKKRASAIRAGNIGKGGGA